jgi:hypothetical protein
MREMNGKRRGTANGPDADSWLSARLEWQYLGALPQDHHDAQGPSVVRREIA